MDTPLDRPRPLLTRADLLPLAVLVVLALFFHRPVLTGGAVLMGDDVLIHHLPTAKAIYEAVKERRLPLWNADVMLGYPLYAEGQAGVFYPTTLALHALTGLAVDSGLPLPPGPPWRHPLVADLFIHHLALALLVYLLARQLFSSPSASLLAATAFAYGGFTIGHLLHPNVVRSLVYLPLLWLLSIRATAHRTAGTARDGVAHGVALGLLFLAGHHQSALYIGVAWVAFVGFLEYACGSPAGRVRRVLGRVAGPVLLGIALASVQLWPTCELWSLSVRNQATTTAERLTWSFTPARWASFLLPFLQGSEQSARPYFGPGLFHELVSYVGVVPLLLIALARPWRDADPVARFLAVFGLGGLMLAAGPASPLYPVHLVPPFSLFRSPGRFVFWVELALALLAARGLDRVLAGASSSASTFIRHYPPRRLLMFGLCFVLVAALGRHLAAGAGTARERPILAHVGEGGIAIVVLVLGVRLLLGARASGRVSVAACAAGLALVAAVDSVGFFASRVWDFRELRPVLVEPGPIAFLRARSPGERFFLDTFPATRSLQEYVRWRSHAVNVLSDLPSVAGYFSPLTPRAWVSFFRPSEAPTSGNYDVVLDTIARLDPVRDQWKLSLAGTAWVLTSSRLVPPGYAPHSGEDGITLYRNERALPRLYVARALRAWKPEEHRERALAALSTARPSLSIERAGEEDLVAEVLAAGAQGGEPGKPTARAAGIPASCPEELLARTDLDAPGWLVVADLAYPGWKAFVRDQEVPLHTACGLFRAVQVPAGVSTIRMSFQPPVLRAGARISLGTVLFIVLVLGAGLVARKQAPAGEPGAPATL